jgi:hypothetical protein
MMDPPSPESTPPASPYTSKECFKLLESDAMTLPDACKQYKDVAVALQRKNSKKYHAVAFEGMAPGEAAAAMRAREAGKLNHPQIQRRMTSGRNSTLW